jgi:hypothetical protein
MGIDGKSRDAERLTEHNACGFVADTGQRFEQRHVARHDIVVTFAEQHRKRCQVACFGRCEPARLDQR